MAAEVNLAPWWLPFMDLRLAGSSFLFQGRHRAEIWIYLCQSRLEALFATNKAFLAKNMIISRNDSESPGQLCCSKKRCASSAAMQPVPAEVMAWR